MALKKQTGNAQLNNGTTTTTETTKPKGKLPHIKVRIKGKDQPKESAIFVSCWAKGLTEKGTMKFSGKFEDQYVDIFLDDKYYSDDYENILKEADERLAQFPKK